jgi:hypothetical protein
MKVENMVPLAPIGFGPDLQSARIVLAKGKEIEPYIDQLVDLHVAVFREPPYYCEWTLEEYVPFIEMYAKSEEGLACMLFEGKRLIGAATGMPLKEMPELWLKSFKGPTDRTYYLGEELILEKYRNRHLGKELFEQFEKSIPRSYDTLAFLRLDDPSEISLNEILRSRGCVENKEIELSFPWKDIRTKETSEHKFYFWDKTI